MVLGTMALATAQNRCTGFPVALRGVTHSVVQGPMPVARGHHARGPMAVAGGLMTDAGGTMPPSPPLLLLREVQGPMPEVRWHLAGGPMPVAPCRWSDAGGIVPPIKEVSSAAVVRSLVLVDRSAVLVSQSGSLGRFLLWHGPSNLDHGPPYLAPASCDLPIITIFHSQFSFFIISGKPKTFFKTTLPPFL